jgi:hypothetical protein
MLAGRWGGASWPAGGAGSNIRPFSTCRCRIWTVQRLEHSGKGSAAAWPCSPQRSCGREAGTSKHLRLRGLFRRRLSSLGFEQDGRGWAVALHLHMLRGAHVLPALAEAWPGSSSAPAVPARCQAAKQRLQRAAHGCQKALARPRRGNAPTVHRESRRGLCAVHSCPLPAFFRAFDMF